jgi:hypothetical protein
MMFRIPSCRQDLTPGFVLFDDFPGSVGISRRHKNADREDVGQPSLAHAVQLAADALAVQRHFDNLCLAGIIECVDGHGFIGFHFRLLLALPNNLDFVDDFIDVFHLRNRVMGKLLVMDAWHLAS